MSFLAQFPYPDLFTYTNRDHSLGLNCGIWDYSASFIAKFGSRPNFVLPDRSKYVNMERHFLKSYMRLVVKTCHSRGAPATGGMAALLLPGDDADKRKAVVEAVKRAKSVEIGEGVDGFMIYDLGLVKPINDLWRELAGPAPSSSAELRSAQHSGNVSAADLLEMPSGGVTRSGLEKNVVIGIAFIDAWLRKDAVGNFPLNGVVEDSATAEISRSQIWQWITHGTRQTNSNAFVAQSKAWLKIISLFLD